MIIEFGLPNGAGGMAAAHGAARVRAGLKNWQEKYKTLVCIRSTHHDYRHWIEVEFLDPKHYTLFALTWAHPTFMKYQKVKS